MTAADIWDAYTDYRSPAEFFQYSKPKERVSHCIDAYAKWAAHEAKSSGDSRGVRTIAAEVYSGMIDYVESLGVDTCGTNNQASKRLARN